MRVISSISLALVFFCSCQSRVNNQYVQAPQQAPQPDPTDEGKLRSDYLDIQAKLASLKQATLENIKTYELSLDREDPLNRRDSIIAKQQVVESATSLQVVCNSALENESMLKTVSGSQRNVKEYAAFVEGVLAKYGPNAISTETEPPSGEQPATNDEPTAQTQTLP
jgi:hypothetical protein